MFPAAGPPNNPRICGHCGRDAGLTGFASWNGIPVCNPESGTGHMECYNLIRDFHHDIPCTECRRVVAEGGAF